MSGDFFVPSRGDILWIDFGGSPENHDTFGHEQQKLRPALCISVYEFNRARGLAIVCPISSQVRDFPTLVRVPSGLLAKESVIMVDQVRAVDWRARNGRFEVTCPSGVVAEVLRKLETLFGN